MAFSLLFHYGTTAQTLTAREGSFGIDTENKIIVWHQNNLDSLMLSEAKLKKFDFGGKFNRMDSGAELSYSEAIPLKTGKESYDLYITRLPIIHLDVENDIKDNVKILGQFTYFYGDEFLKSPVGIEHRGNLSLTFPKKSYDLEFWTDNTSKTQKDVKFHGLKSEDDFILDGLYNEPLRLRSYMASKLWLDVHRPHYATDEPKARSGVNLKYVELFKNGSYQGIYALSESVNRSLLELAKNEGRQVHGELFKASSYEGAPSFKKAPEYNSLFPHWAGFEMKYPVIDYKSHWKDLARLVNLAVHSDDGEFNRAIAKSLNIDNVVDYYLFVNLLRATDNLGKNYYLARYDENHPYFFVPWDLDGVMGTIQDGKRIATTNDLLGNGLFDRLIALNTDGFVEKLEARWSSLRESEYSNDSLFNRMDKIYTAMKSEKRYEREQKVWPDKRTEEEHYDYIKEWLKDRLIFLDDKFSNMASSSQDNSRR